jgi:hypothetical protein
MNAQSLPMTAALSTLAHKHDVDLSPFARAELALHEMTAAFFARDDDAFDRASERFDEAMKARMK